MIKLIAAVGKQGQIGQAGKVPWHNPEDLAWFRNLTWGQTVVVGWKTFQTLPKLENRKVIVYSGNLEEILEMPGDLWIAGGAQTYKDFMPYVDRCYVSRINYDGPADAWMPALW